ncbi:hypothetical protein B0I35DRAFT_404181 [Stachybotrys elegans]|uniref:Uncharacterized protein n=1 Tax=Stachybotrys elegans TaxID=80388 RepID=A0A8K0WWP0_9HYPO|nr:hypothetical protein B0I35DRAFT_404181 [Stachybotrys elegans]
MLSLSPQSWPHRRVNGRLQLPPEIIYQIIETVLPLNDNLFLPPTGVECRTLLSLVRVNKEVHMFATKILRERCNYVESRQRLTDMLACLPRTVPSMPSIMPLRSMTSLYLEPFGETLDDLHTAELVRELLREVGPTLRRLIVKMPFNSLELEDDRDHVQRTLREGFESLDALEEFACLGQYPVLIDPGPGPDADVWRLWPELRRLALFGVPLDSHWLWWDIATLPRLERVVLSRCDNLGGTNIKQEYFHTLPDGDNRLTRDVTVVIMDLGREIGTIPCDNWKTLDPEERMTVALFEVPGPAVYDAHDADTIVTDLVLRGALTGELWGWVTQVLW